MFTDFYKTIFNKNEDTLVITFNIVLITLVLSFINYVFLTDLILLFGLKVLQIMAGLRIKYVTRKCGKGVWCYAEKGQKRNDLPTLIWLHGIGADKDTWPTMIKYVSSKYHCIALDLPGHGGTTFIEELDKPSLVSYVKSLKEFLEVVGLNNEPVHIIGSSFGASIAYLFAYYYPENTAKLVLLAPAIRTPKMSYVFKEIMNGEYDILIPKSGRDAINMIESFTNKRQFYPVRIMDSFVKSNYTDARKSLLVDLMKNIANDESNSFESSMNKLREIKSKVLIMWGENDKLGHLSGAYLMNENIPESKIKILSDCNHVILIDKPWEATEEIMDFLNLSINRYAISLKF